VPALGTLPGRLSAVRIFSSSVWRFLCGHAVHPVLDSSQCVGVVDGAVNLHYIVSSIYSKTYTVLGFGRGQRRARSGGTRPSKTRRAAARAAASPSKPWGQRSDAQQGEPSISLSTSSGDGHLVEVSPWAAPDRSGNRAAAGRVPPADGAARAGARGRVRGGAGARRVQADQGADADRGGLLTQNPQGWPIIL
jgi:hypothetical protein